MKTSQTFNNIHSRKKERLTLRVRMVLWVQVELLACVGLAFLIDKIAHTLSPHWNVPLLLILVTVSIIVGGIMTAVISRAFFHPIKNLCQAMDKVANGDFTVRLDPDRSSSNEIKELYAGFNLMTSELRTTEILQTDFISNVSHEFKTPINAVEGYTMLLQNTENIDETENRYIEKILFNTRRLSSLVSNILLLSKLENQSIPTNRENYALDEQIREDILALEPLWESKAIEFDVDLEGVNYYGNKSVLHHVWSNLLSNAVKFSPKSGAIKIRLFTKNEKIIFIIEDNGPGLSDEAQKHLFDKFYQADTSHKEEGNGLGLALAKNIVTHCKGEISAENIENGCRFKVTLPIN